MKILVTGGAGFIGSNFVRYSLEQDSEHEIVILDDLSTGRLSNIEGLDAKFVEGSVSNGTLVDEVASNTEAIVHLGALGSVPRSIADPMASHIANLTGTLNVMEAARNHGCYVVFASSSSVYGANIKLPKSEYDWTRPMSPYAVTKLGAEGYVLAYQYAYKMASMAFRFFNVYGPNQAADHAYAAVIPKFLDAALSEKPLEIHGDGLQSRDFTYVDTVCQALYAAVSRRVSSPDPVNLAFGTNTTLLELIDLLERNLDEHLNVAHIGPREGDVRASQSDGIRLRELFPEVQPVPLERGLADTIGWFQSL